MLSPVSVLPWVCTQTTQVLRILRSYTDRVHAAQTHASAAPTWSHLSSLSEVSTLAMEFSYLSTMTGAPLRRRCSHSNRPISKFSFSRLIRGNWYTRAIAFTVRKLHSKLSLLVHLNMELGCNPRGFYWKCSISSPILGADGLVLMPCRPGQPLSVTMHSQVAAKLLLVHAWGMQLMVNTALYVRLHPLNRTTCPDINLP